MRMCDKVHRQGEKAYEDLAQEVEKRILQLQEQGGYIAIFLASQIRATSTGELRKV